MDYQTVRTVIIIVVILFAVFSGFVAWACLVVGARADRLSERIVEAMIAKRIEQERLDEIERKQ